MKDDVVEESTTVQKLTVEEARTTSDDTTQNDTTVDATTTPDKSNQQGVEEKEVEPPLNSEQVESDSKKDVGNDDVSSVDRGGSDNDVVIMEKENDADPSVAKLHDHTDDISIHSNQNPRDSDYKPHKQRGLDQKHSSKVQSCLLYTSPSPRDQRGSRMPSSA